MTIGLSLGGRAQAAWEAEEAEDGETDAATDGAVEAAVPVDATGLGDAVAEQPEKTTALTASDASIGRMPRTPMDRVEWTMILSAPPAARRKSIAAIDFVICGSIGARPSFCQYTRDRCEPRILVRGLDRVGVSPQVSVWPSSRHSFC